MKLAVSRVLLVVVALLWVGPYAWMVLTSLRTLPEIVAAPAWPIPKSVQLEAYREVLTTIPVGRYFLNTTVMAVAIALLQILLALPADTPSRNCISSARRPRLPWSSPAS